MVLRDAEDGDSMGRHYLAHAFWLLQSDTLRELIRHALHSTELTLAEVNTVFEYYPLLMLVFNLDSREAMFPGTVWGVPVNGDAIARELVTAFFIAGMLRFRSTAGSETAVAALDEDAEEAVQRPTFNRSLFAFLSIVRTSGEDRLQVCQEMFDNGVVEEYELIKALLLLSIFPLLSYHDI